MNPIEELHQCYVEMTRHEIRMPVWERAFADFLANGFTCDDLRMVLGHILRENRRMNGVKFSLRLNTLLDYQYERFDSFLAEAKAIQRNKVKISPKEAILATRTGGQTVTNNSLTAIPVKDVLRKLAAEL